MILINCDTLESIDTLLKGASRVKATDLISHPNFFANFRVPTIEKFRGDYRFGHLNHYDPRGD